MKKDLLVFTVVSIVVYRLLKIFNVQLLIFLENMYIIVFVACLNVNHKEQMEIFNLNNRLICDFYIPSFRFVRLECLEKKQLKQNITTLFYIYNRGVEQNHRNAEGFLRNYIWTVTDKP